VLLRRFRRALGKDFGTLRRPGGLGPRPEGQAIVPSTVEDALKKNPQAKAVFAQHTETSTGVVNDMPQTGRHRFQNTRRPGAGRHLGLGGQELRTNDWKVDVVVSGSQKGLMTAPGLAMVSLSPKTWPLVEASKPAVLFRLPNDAHVHP